MGEDAYLEKCREKLRSTGNPKYDDLIRQYGGADENARGILEKIGEVMR